MVIIDTHRGITIARALCIAAAICASTGISAAEKPSQEGASLRKEPAGPSVRRSTSGSASGTTQGISFQKALYERVLTDGPVFTQGVEKIKLPKLPEVSVVPPVVSQEDTGYRAGDARSSTPSQDVVTALQDNITQQIHSRWPFAVRLALKSNVPKGRLGLVAGGLTALEKAKYDSCKEDRLLEERPASEGCVIS